MIFVPWYFVFRAFLSVFFPSTMNKRENYKRNYKNRPLKSKSFQRNHFFVYLAVMTRPKLQMSIVTGDRSVWGQSQVEI